MGTELNIQHILHPGVTAKGMHKLIADSGGWRLADQSVTEIRGQLGKKKGQIDLQINNLLNVLADGRGSESILDRLASMEAQKVHTGCRNGATGSADQAQYGQTPDSADNSAHLVRDARPLGLRV